MSRRSPVAPHVTPEGVDLGGLVRQMRVSQRSLEHTIGQLASCKSGPRHEHLVSMKNALKKDVARLERAVDAALGVT